jgi:beta-glucosidase
MTLEEKVSQMRDHAVAILLGVPKYDWWNEGLHGVASRVTPRTSRKSLNGRDLGHQSCASHGRNYLTEALSTTRPCAKTTTRCFSTLPSGPLTSTSRDPRWDVGQETYGEDPSHRPDGRGVCNWFVQGRRSQIFKLVSTPKHYAA